MLTSARFPKLSAADTEMKDGSVKNPEVKNVNMVLSVHRNRTAYQGRGEGGGDMEVGGEGDYIPIATLSPPE